MSAIEELRGAGVESGGRAGAAEQRGAGAGGTAERMVVVAASEAARGGVAGRGRAVACGRGWCCGSRITRERGEGARGARARRGPW